jgi:hypothetical protein
MKEKTIHVAADMQVLMALVCPSRRLEAQVAVGEHQYSVMLPAINHTICPSSLKAPLKVRPLTRSGGAVSNVLEIVMV